MNSSKTSYFGIAAGMLFLFLFSSITFIIIGIKNIGIYVSQKNSILTTVDTTYNYSGFNVSSISSFGNSIINQQELTDSIRLISDTTQFVGLLPFEIYLFSLYK